MPLSPRTARTATALAAAGVILGLAQLPATGSTATADSPLDTIAKGAVDQVQRADGLLATWGDSPLALPDLDLRGSVLPTADQRKAAGALGATVRWNRFGTPSSIFDPSGDLGPATGADEVAGARAWLQRHRAAFGLDSAQVASLELVSSQKLADSGARAVLFRQRFGKLSAALGSMVTVGVADGRVAYVSSSLARTAAAEPEAARLSPVQAWQIAAASVGRETPLTKIEDTLASGWTRLKVAGFAQEQQVRLRALALADGTVRPVFETNVVDSADGEALAYTLMVDAASGRVLHRENKVEHLAAAASEGASPFQGAITAKACGPRHPFEVTDGKTKQIVVAATAVNPANDIVVKIYAPNGELLTSGDLLTSPETATFSADRIPAGKYTTQICPFDAPTVPFTAPGEYVGTVATSDAESPALAAPYPPKWSYFTANPQLNFSTSHVPTNRVTECWEKQVGGRRVEGCGPGELKNLASRAPWDFDFVTGLPTLTTAGNNALTREAWASPLTPGGVQGPVSPQRSYTPKFTDAWQNSRCDPANLVPGGNDIDASVTNLFAAHNRMHDYSYFLGFTEENYNMQVRNLGGNPNPLAENDPEIGDAQAGAISGHMALTGLGRDNANQITLQDGVPGITNQYLFQPIAAGFYAPCTDGGFDMSIVGHEYTHAISNRMIGGPDEGITSEQGGAMGESWGDLVAAEYLISHGYATGSNPWAVGPYATGNRQAGIRDYPINRNPLQYGDYGFDSTGPEVHADGEIWNAVQYDVRQALVAKYNRRFPASDRGLQRRCASGTATSGPLPAYRCPGNRRWVQLMFDSFLLQQGATSMLDARDAMLAADRMRFRGANQRVLWAAYARNGMGVDARTSGADSHDPKPGYQAPGVRPGQVRFVAKDGRRFVPGRFFVGHYEARVTPVADTLRRTRLGNTVRFVPGRYDLLFQGKGSGLQRARFTVRPGRRQTVVVRAPRNLASKHAGGKVVRSSAGSLNASSLIDDTEATNWAGANETTSVDTRGANPYVVVDLAGGRQMVRRVNVSAMLRPAGEDASDPDSGSRFTALRRFAIEVCTSGCTTAKARWKRIYTSRPDAFPGARPRPVAPNLNLRSFDVRDTPATHVRLVALENQCTGYAGYAGEQDDDPLNDTDCKAASDRDLSVRVAELQVFNRN